MTYVSNHIQSEEYIAKNGVRQSKGGVNPWLTAGMGLGTDIIGGILSGDIKFGGDGKGGSDNGKVDKKIQEQIDKLTKEKEELLKSHNAKTLEELNTAISTSENSQKTIEGNIEKTELDIKTFQTIVDNYPNKKSELEKQIKSENDGQKKSLLQKELEQLETDKNKADEEIRTLNTNLENLQKELKQEQIKYAELNTTKAQVENLDHEILKLKGKDLPAEVTYDVTKEKDDLKNFNTALKKFNAIESPTPADAAELVAAYESGDNGVQNPTAKKAFDFVKNKHKELFDKLALV